MSDRVSLLSDAWRDRVAGAVDWLQARGFGAPVGLVLGSGLGNFVDAVENAEAVPYGDIPGYATTTVAEHKGRLVQGKAAGRDVIVMQGRLHPYEGLPWDQLLLPTANGKGRCAIHEILLRSSGLANVIREGNTTMLSSLIQSGRASGMQCMDDGLLAAVDSGQVLSTDAYMKATDKSRFRAPGEVAEPTAA